jgi:hypothetical protein
MIRDASQDRFDLIITKEIARFSRSTLDSIKYTQELLGYGVGVFFQADNINTLYSDAELRLTIMSSLAQDEVRRLSERVKFGMKRAYESGRVLGRDNIYGYDKHKGRLAINDKEAAFVRELFSLYADGQYGFRTIARLLTEKGYRSQAGKEINPASLKGVLTNPKYKGYYRGRLTESRDYRSKKNMKIAAEEQILHKDENVPPIVTEELWDRANAIITQRSAKFKKKEGGTQTRFPYSGKIMCEAHGTYYYRKMWTDRKVPAESWCCREYLAKGRKGCLSPHIYTRELDAILEYIGNDLLADKEKYARSIDGLIELYKRSETANADYISEKAKISKEIAKTKTKQDKILELHIDGDMDKNTYLEMNARFRQNIERLTAKLQAAEADREAASNSEAVLRQAKDFLGKLPESGDCALDVARSLLHKVVVCEGSSKNLVKLRIMMKYGKILPASVARNFILYSETEIYANEGNGIPADHTDANGVVHIYNAKRIRLQVRLLDKEYRSLGGGKYSLSKVKQIVDEQ